MNCGECRWHRDCGPEMSGKCESGCGDVWPEGPLCKAAVALADAEAALARRDAAIALALTELDNLRTPGLSYLASVTEAARVLREATEKEVVP